MSIHASPQFLFDALPCIPIWKMVQTSICLGIPQFLTPCGSIISTPTITYICLHSCLDCYQCQCHGFLSCRCISYHSALRRALREMASPGKSGSVFFLSGDDRFMIKTVSHEEMLLLLKLIPAYYRHCVENPATLLTRFYGVHRIKSITKGGSKARTALHLQLCQKWRSCGRTCPIA